MNMAVACGLDPVTHLDGRPAANGFTGTIHAHQMGLADHQAHLPDGRLGGPGPHGNHGQGGQQGGAQGGDRVRTVEHGDLQPWCDNGSQSR
jgi:hypothetical protein